MVCAFYGNITFRLGGRAQKWVGGADLGKLGVGSWDFDPNVNVNEWEVGKESHGLEYTRRVSDFWRI